MWQRVGNILHGGAKRGLDRWWNISDRASALDALSALTEVNVHTPATDMDYQRIRTGSFESVHVNSKELIFDDWYIDYLLEHLEAHGINTENIDSLEDLEALDLPDHFYTEVEREVSEQVMFYQAYLKARDMLINKLGYTEEELSGIKTLAAWDYGRVGFVARESVFVGHLEESDVWEYIQSAAIRASATYRSWREYVAAYVLGRAVGFGRDSTKDLLFVLDYLLHHPNSPFFAHDFRFVDSAVFMEFKRWKNEKILQYMINNIVGDPDDEDTQGDFDYTQENVDECSEILDGFIDGLSLVQNSDGIMQCVEAVVKRLNELNAKCNKMLIETAQRENLCEFIQLAAGFVGLEHTKDDITEEWREW